MYEYSHFLMSHVMINVLYDSTLINIFISSTTSSSFLVTL